MPSMRILTNLQLKIRYGCKDAVLTESMQYCSLGYIHCVPFLSISQMLEGVVQASHSALVLVSDKLLLLICPSLKVVSRLRKSPISSL